MESPSTDFGNRSASSASFQLQIHRFGFCHDFPHGFRCLSDSKPVSWLTWSDECGLPMEEALRLAAETVDSIKKICMGQNERTHSGPSTSAPRASARSCSISGGNRGPRTRGNRCALLGQTGVGRAETEYYYDKLCESTKGCCQAGPGLSGKSGVVPSLPALYARKRR